MFQPVTNNVIPAWMPESNHRDVKLCLAPRRVMPQRYRASYHPLRLRSGQAMALDTGIHAGMTVLAEVPC